MSEPFIAEIRIFASTFAPSGWADCNGAILPIAQNTALFSLVGTTFGGDGRTSFGLPNLQGRAPMHPGTGPGLTSRQLGETGGSATVTLNASSLPAHTHALQASTDEATTSQADGKLPAVTREDAYATGGTTASMSPGAVQLVGGGQAHNNLQPYLVLRFIIALQGIFPSRS